MHFCKEMKKYIKSLILDYTNFENQGFLYILIFSFHDKFVLSFFKVHNS